MSYPITYNPNLHNNKDYTLYLSTLALNIMEIIEDKVIVESQADISITGGDIAAEKIAMHGILNIYKILSKLKNSDYKEKLINKFIEIIELQIPDIKNHSYYANTEKNY